MLGKLSGVLGEFRMIARVASSTVSAGAAARDAGGAGRARPGTRKPPRPAAQGEDQRPRAGIPPRGPRRGAGLEDFAREPDPLPVGARAAAAARAFAAGNGFLPGLLVDRLA